MERFNNLMDDMKFAVTLSLKNKGLFLPALIANIVFFVLGIVLVIGIVAIATSSIIRLRTSSFDGGFASGPSIALIAGLIIGGLVIFLLMALTIKYSIAERCQRWTIYACSVCHIIMLSFATFPVKILY